MGAGGPELLTAGGVATPRERTRSRCFRLSAPPSPVGQLPRSGRSSHRLGRVTAACWPFG
ncbi:hypothetical protein AvCA_40080 [Azotobacter vinelandii CA]|uniref:Uncharacterized protein n=2 Tax=Azotobacter vinelandii TaxID=354 RepID=C1DE37_AZOVD|nr:hypothetical protein Avin_40080 [Azotobacter vinelandii DJ]AGK16094.1 hypothetical protein AvCA_40080 [Azotobacter vinelandii CA]AGK21731.1 hypothetical protein AvCA6_40080 [Azotobacter vinelandii CA6]